MFTLVTTPWVYRSKINGPCRVELISNWSRYRSFLAKKCWKAAWKQSQNGNYCVMIQNSYYDCCCTPKEKEVPLKWCISFWLHAVRLETVLLMWIYAWLFRFCFWRSWWEASDTISKLHEILCKPVPVAEQKSVFYHSPVYVCQYQIAKTSFLSST